jgi:hypothetical protein
MEPLSDPIGKRKKFTVTVKLDGLLRCIVDHLAVMTALEVDFQHVLEFVVHIAIEIARKLLERIFTFHECLTSFQNLAQLLAKAQPCPEQAGFDGAFRQVQQFRCLLGGKPFHIAEEKNCPESDRQ